MLKDRVFKMIGSNIIWLLSHSFIWVGLFQLADLATATANSDFKDWCSDPEKAVCEKRAFLFNPPKVVYHDEEIYAYQAENEKRIEQSVKESLLAHGLALEGDSHHEILGRWSLDLRSNDLKTKDLAISLWTKFITGYESSLNQEILKKNKVTISQIFEVSKNQLINAISQTSSGLSQSLKNEFIQRLKRLKLVSSSDPEMRDIFIQICGISGEAENANGIPGKDIFFVCPGYSVSTLGLRHGLTSSAFILGHEIGHFLIAEKSDLPAYRHLIEGLESSPMRNKLKKLSESELESLNSAEYTDFLRKIFEKKSLNEIETHFPEIGADYWGTLNLKKTLLKVPSHQKRVEITSDFIQFLCDSEDEGFHPTGSFRIQWITRQLSDVLGCSLPSKNH